MAIMFNTPEQEASARAQIKNFQTTLASLNQQVISLQEALKSRDEVITRLRSESPHAQEESTRIDETHTIGGLLVKFFNYFFVPGKAVN